MPDRISLGTLDWTVQSPVSSMTTVAPSTTQRYRALNGDVIRIDHDESLSSRSKPLWSQLNSSSVSTTMATDTGRAFPLIGTHRSDGFALIGFLSLVMTETLTMAWTGATQARNVKTPRKMKPRQARCTMPPHAEREVHKATSVSIRIGD